MGSQGITHDRTPKGMDDLTNKLSFDSQATWVIDVLGLFFDMLPYLSMNVLQPGTDRRPVDWRRN